MADDQWLTRKEAAKFLVSLGCPVAIRTLEMWGSAKPRKGPPLRRTPWSVRYDRTELKRWADSQVVNA